MVVSRLVFGFPRFFCFKWNQWLLFLPQYDRSYAKCGLASASVTSHVAGSMRAFTSSVDMRLGHKIPHTCHTILLLKLSIFLSISLFINQVLQPKSIMDWAYAL